MTRIWILRRAAALATAFGMASGAALAACPVPPPGFTTSVSTPCMARVSWGAVPGASGYRLWRSPVNDFSTAVVYPNLPPTTLTIGDTVVVPNQTYYYWIATLTTDTASCPTGVGPIGGPASAAVVGSAPSAPSNIAATAGCNSVSLRWNTAPGVTSYQVLRSFTPDLSQAQVVETVAPTPPMTATSVFSPPGPEFSYWVRAINSCGTSPASAPVQASALSAAPAAIQNFQVSNGTRCDGILVNWTVPAIPPDSYIYTRTAVGGASVTTNIPGTAGVLLDYGIPGEQYTITMTPVNACGNGPTSSQPGLRSPTNLTFVAQPVSRLVAPHGSVSFMVALGGPGSPAATVVWRKDGVPITLGGRFTQQQWTLTINDVVPEDAALYDCIAGGNLGYECSITSAAAVLGVQVNCRADFNLSGELSVQDLFDYLTAFFGGCP